MTPEKVGIRTPAAQVEITEGALSVFPRGSLRDDEVLDLIRRAFRCVAPKSFHFRVGYSFLVSIADQPYDEARLSALEHLSLSGLGASDFALLVEGTVAKVDWRCEIGIVSAEEVEPRLRRWVGRMSDSWEPTPSFVDLPSDVQPVSVFVDFLWLEPNRECPHGDATEEIAQRIGESESKAETVVSRIYGQIVEGSLETTGGRTRT